jgi:hypothetical protein
MESCTKPEKSLMEESKKKTGKTDTTSKGPTKDKKGKGSKGKFSKIEDGDKGGKATKGQYGLKDGESSDFDKKKGSKTAGLR